MKILQFTNFYPPPFAGTERYVLELTENLLKRGHQVHIVYVPLIYTKEPAKITVEPPKGATFAYIHDRLSFLRLFEEVKKYDPDIIQTHYLKTALRAQIVGSVLKKPVVCSLLLADERTKPLKRKIGTRLLAPLFRKINYVAISREIEESIKKDVRGANVTFIPVWAWNNNKMADADGTWLRKKFPKNAKIFFAASRIVEEKGIRRLIYVAESAAKKRDDIYFAVAGDGPMLREYEALVKQLNLGEKFLFLGHLGNGEIADSYKGCDAVILPFIMDSLFAVTEVLVIRKPIIANRTRSTAEIIENEKNGFLADITDPDAFSDVLIKAIDNLDLCGMLIKNALAKSAQYSPEVCTSRIIELYKSLVSSNKG